MRRIVVYEMDDIVNRRKSSLPCLMVVSESVTISDSKLLSLIRKRKSYWAQHVVRLRPDLYPAGEFEPGSSALKSAKTRVQNELSRKGFCVNPSPKLDYRIYVIEIDESVLREGPGPWVYVGMTSLRPSERISQHLGGKKKASQHWRSFIARRTDLEPCLLVHSVSDAEAEESAWGMHLQQLGYKVKGPHDIENKLKKKPKV